MRAVTRTACSSTSMFQTLRAGCQFDTRPTHHFRPLPSSDLLPVLFWTHGGGYNSGSGREADFGPLYFLSHGVVVVTVRYRCCCTFSSSNCPGWALWGSCPWAQRRCPATWGPETKWQPCNGFRKTFLASEVTRIW